MCLSTPVSFQNVPISYICLWQVYIYDHVQVRPSIPIYYEKCLFSRCITCVCLGSLSDMFVFFIYEYRTSLAQDEWPYHVRFGWYVPAGRLHSTLLAVCGSRDPRTPIKLYHAVIHIEYHLPRKHFWIGCSSLFVPLATTTHGTSRLVK